MKTTESTPLRLEDTFFPEIEVKANPEFFKGQCKEGFSVETRCTIFPDEQKATRFSLQLHLRVLDRDEKALSPYHVNLTAFGGFSVDDEHVEHFQSYVTAAVSILVSSARELTLQLTGRGPGPSIQIPTLNPGKIIHDAEVVEMDHETANPGNDGVERRA